MNSLFDRLNLPARERRFIIIALALVFVFLNYWLVWPHFKDLAGQKQKRLAALDALARYQVEIDQSPGFDKRRQELESQGSSLAVEEAAVQLLREVRNHADQSGITPNGLSTVSSGVSTNKNSLFAETSARMGFTTSDKAMVDFLYNLGAGKSMIRVRDLNINPDPKQLNLMGNVTLTTSYQKRPATPAASAKPTTPAAPRTAPVTAPQNPDGPKPAPKKTPDAKK